MFYFFSSQQTPENLRYHKGLLFEQLLRKYLDNEGYSCSLTRTKSNSLEYDVTGTHRVDSRKIIGEAKAHEDTITGQDIAAFIGKFAPHHYTNNGQITGLFLSTSALSPDGNDYLQNVKNTAPFNIHSYCGSDLETRIKTALHTPADPAIEAKFSPLGLRSHGTHLLHTNNGTFVIVVLSSTTAGFPTGFAVLGADAQVVSDGTFLSKLRENVPALRELEPVFSNPAQPKRVESRTDVPLGLVTSTDWLDFRRPAGTDFFVGREQALAKADEALNSGQSSIVEIKSRSGVGKSSLLIALHDRWTKAGHRVELHDARDVHSATDVLRLIERFTGTSQITSFEEISHALNKLDINNNYVILIDQFEATFQNPEVFRAYEYTAMCIARASSNCAMVFARKDDLLTTHDELKIDIERLRGMAQAIVLEDFNKTEAFELLQKAATAFPRKTNPQILSQILEFAQGFPWLLRRTFAHVIRTLQKRTSQQELLSTGLQLKELFDEELSELDEIERGYLTRIVGALPATYHSLISRYEGDPQLPRMLEKLTARRILRFSAGTYDTYNDVFKDFLLYDRLPERSQSALFKMGPATVMKAFRALKGKNSIDVSDFGDALGKTTGGTYNTLRELRLAGLATRDSHGWTVPQVARDYEHQHRLGEYVRQSMLKNIAVSAFLSGLNDGKHSNIQLVVAFLQEHFPFTQAKDSIWSTYARTFISWLDELCFISIDSAGSISIFRGEHSNESISESLGNLALRTRGGRSRQAPFLPSKEISVLERVLLRASETPTMPHELGRSERAALADLIRLGAASSDGDSIVSLMTLERFRERVQELLTTPPYLNFWAGVQAGFSYVDSLDRAFPSLSLAHETRKTLSEKLVSWGKHTGHLPPKRFTSKSAR